MSLRAYTLSVSLAAVVGMLLTVVPLVRSGLEYRSPSVEMTKPRELASLEAFVVERGRNAAEVSLMLRSRSAWQSRYGSDMWQVMYDEAKAQHAEALRQQVEAVRRKAARNVMAYGTLFVLSIVLLITHLIWARRVS
jgi:hypothetical protein